MAKILAIGIATLDIINIVDCYPDEDSEIRALSQHQTRGGNATNTLTVLSQHGHQCHWAGVLIDEADSNLILNDLIHHKIDTTACSRLATGKMPTSYITVSQKTGSRSIIHHRVCPEYSFEDFSKIDLSKFDWLHFEGRNIIDTRLMLQHVKTHYPDLPCSLEIEKPRATIASLFELPSLLILSKQYANSQGYSNPNQLLKSLPANTTAVCTWGDQGAWAITATGESLHSDAFPPNKLIDTLGAGDTFNAGLIHSLVNHKTLSQALTYASQLAGQKCGQQGFDNLLANFK